MEELKKSLLENAADLVKMGGQIHPLVGGIVALLITGGLIYLGIKVKKKLFQERVSEVAGKVQVGTSKDQKTSKSINDGIDDFLDSDDENNS